MKIRLTLFISILALCGCLFEDFERNGQDPIGYIKEFTEITGAINGDIATPSIYASTKSAQLTARLSVSVYNVFKTSDMDRLNVIALKLKEKYNIIGITLKYYKIERGGLKVPEEVIVEFTL